MLYSGCNWYGFGATFFGCLSMVIHGSISIVRCLPIVQPYAGHNLSLRGTFLLLSFNVVYSAIFALGWFNSTKLLVPYSIIAYGHSVRTSVRLFPPVPAQCRHLSLYRCRHLPKSKIPSSLPPCNSPLLLSLLNLSCYLEL